MFYCHGATPARAAPVGMRGWSFACLHIGLLSSLLKGLSGWLTGQCRECLGSIQAVAGKHVASASGAVACLVVRGGCAAVHITHESSACLVSLPQPHSCAPALAAVPAKAPRGMHGTCKAHSC